MDKETLNIEKRKVVLFDGVCNLCNFWVDMLMRKDKKQKLFFSSLQSEFGQKVLRQHKLPTKEFDSFLFLDDDKLYQKSTASLHVFANLGGMWSIIKIFFIIPAPIRNWVYSLIAKNRYSLFGKSETCRLPTEEEKKRFI